VGSQPLVDEGVVRGEKIHHAAVVAEHAVDEHFHLAAERGPERAIESRVNEWVGLQRVHVANLQPLKREVGGQGPRAGVGQHAPHLLLQHRGIAQLPLRRHVQELVVGHAAPQEE
jgi:hypothetical protein